jgi:DNA-binding transcriptional regulator PaaX
MKPNADELLSLVLSCLQMLSSPTSLLLGPSFTEWDREGPWRPGFRNLRRRGWIRPAPASASFPFVVTRAGHERALGTPNPEACWNRSWTGRWLVYAFDLPVKKPASRRHLLRWLHAKRFGCLQKSVWIRPDLPNPSIPSQHDLPREVSGLIVLEAGCFAGFTDTQVVEAAWDFDSINAQYNLYLNLCETKLRELLCADADPQRVVAWLRQEQLAWKNATRVDPFLPKSLWPPDYLGPAAWRARRQLLGL